MFDFNGVLSRFCQTLSKLENKKSPSKRGWNGEKMGEGCWYGRWGKRREEESACTIGLEVCIYRHLKWLPKKLPSNFQEISKKYLMLATLCVAYFPCFYLLIRNPTKFTLIIDHHMLLSPPSCCPSSLYLLLTPLLSKKWYFFMVESLCIFVAVLFCVSHVQIRNVLGMLLSSCQVLWGTFWFNLQLMP